MEDTTTSTSTACAGQKRAAEDASTTGHDNNNGNTNDNGNSTSTAAAPAVAEDEQDHDEQSRQRSAKKPKLSKKEMLLAAKARLKEAQEKQKSLLQSLEEQKQKEQEQQQDGGEEGVEDNNCNNYNDDSYYYYEYMYHIPPVTGSRETLMVTDITSTGPPEKVRFLPEKQVGIESLLRVIQTRQRGISPTPIVISTSGGSKPKDHRPGSRGVSPTPMATTRNTTTQPPLNRTGEEPSNAAAQQQHNGHNHNRPAPPVTEAVTTPAPGLAYGQQRTQFRSTISSYDDKRLPDRSLQDAVEGKHLFGNPPPKGGSSSRPPPAPNSNSRHSSRSNGDESGNHHSSNNDGPSNISRPQHESPGQRPPFRGAIGNNENKRLPDRPLKPPSNAKGGAKTPMPIQEGNKMHHAAPPLPPKGPLKPPPRPWKRALAHITGKTLDCSLDLPSNASYLIRTQDRSVLTRVRFLSAPDNATLLQQQKQQKQQQQKFKHNTPFHLSSLSTLPCNTSYAWKGVDILLFLQNQDQQRNNQKRTYLPPARRNLPLSHWAILELQHPFLPAHQQPLGCFTATLQQSEKQQQQRTGGSKQQQQQDDDRKEDIHFAGKLVWNMTMVDRAESNVNNNRNNNNNAKPVSSKWGEVVGATPTSGLRNGAMVLTVQGLYDYAATATTDNSGSSHSSFPASLQGHKVMLPKSKTIGIIVGSDGCRPPPKQQQSENRNNNKHDSTATSSMMGTCQVLLPNGVASGPSSVQSLLGTRAVLYD